MKSPEWIRKEIEYAEEKAREVEGKGMYTLSELYKARANALIEVLEGEDAKDR